MLELTLLRHFVAVGHARSFTGAARVLQTSQPVITRSVQRLEDIVGTCLVERSTRSVVLTPAGEALLSDAEDILARAAVTLENTRRIGQGAHGRLRIGVCPTTEMPELACGIADFRARWPHIQLRISSIDSAALPDALRTSDIDIGIMQTDGLPIAGISGTVVASFGLIVAAPAAWNYDESKPISLVELKSRPWLMPERKRATVWFESLMGMCRQAGFEPTIAGTVDDPLSARLMIASGVGATFFHDNGKREGQGKISYLQFTDPQIPPPSRTAVSHAEGARSPQIADFIACAVSAYSRRTADKP